jgi:hypothetical protein
VIKKRVISSAMHWRMNEGNLPTNWLYIGLINLRLSIWEKLRRLRKQFAAEIQCDERAGATWFEILILHGLVRPQPTSHSYNAMMKGWKVIVEKSKSIQSHVHELNSPCSIPGDLKENY